MTAMKHLKKNHKAHCLLYAFAMVTDLSPDVFINELGVTGTEEVFPGHPVPLCCRSFHSVELIVVALEYGVHMIHVPQKLGLQCQLGCHQIVFDAPNVNILGRRAIICTGAHAYAWDGCRLIDPDTGKERAMIKQSEIEEVILRVD